MEIALITLALLAIYIALLFMAHQNDNLEERVTDLEDQNSEDYL